MNCFSSAVLTAAVLAAAAAPSSALTIKFATLAPEGTDAMKTVRAIDREIQERTQGNVKFKIYSGGRQGDEKDIVRKIRVGQLHAGGFTGVGLGEIAPEVRILDAPWLFRDHAEVDHVYKTFSKDFEEAFDERGYVLLGWTEVGFVHILSNTPVRKIDDLKELKAWVWEGDPIAEAAYSVLGVHPIPLSITDVNTSLQTGLIDSVYAAPLYAIALQWHEKTKFIYSLQMANASGAVLISKKRFERLSDEQKAIVREVSARRLQALNKRTREENRKAIDVLKKQGLTLTDPASPDEYRKHEEAGVKARRELVGRLFSKELLERVEGALKDFRASSGKKGKK